MSLECTCRNTVETYLQHIFLIGTESNRVTNLPKIGVGEILTITQATFSDVISIIEFYYIAKRFGGIDFLLESVEVVHFGICYML